MAGEEGGVGEGEGAVAGLVLCGEGDQGWGGGVGGGGENQEGEGMTNDEARMTNQIRMTNGRMAKTRHGCSLMGCGGIVAVQRTREE